MRDNLERNAGYAFSIVNDEMRIWYRDASGVVISEGFEWIKVRSSLLTGCWKTDR